MSIILNRYSNILQAAPLRTNLITGAILAGLGDVYVQKYFSHEKYSARRTFNMAFIRAALIVPFLLMWFPIMNNTYPGSDMIAIMKRVAMNEFIGSPIMISIVFLGQAVLSGHISLDYIVRKFKNEFPTAFKKGIYYWTLVHSLFTMRVPVKHQPLVAHIASIYWNGVLSYHAHHEKKETEI